MSNLIKHGVRVYGSAPLLNALLEESKLLGFTADTVDRDKLKTPGQCVLFYKDGVVGTYNFAATSGDGTIQYQLPFQWEEALTALKTKPEPEIVSVEVGNWIKFADELHWGLVIRVDGNYASWLDITLENGIGANGGGIKHCTILDKDEVLERFQTEAKNRGFTIGVGFLSSLTGRDRGTIVNDQLSFVNGHDNCIKVKESRGTGSVIWTPSMGFAKISKIGVDINGYELEVKGNKGNFGCFEFDTNFVETLYRLVSRTTVHIGGKEITKETIKLIEDQLK